MKLYDKIIELLKNAGMFLISDKYKALRQTIITFIIVSSLVLLFVFNVVMSKAISARNIYESRELEIINFSIKENKRIHIGNETLGNVTLYIETNYPVSVKIILDNIRGKEQRIINIDEFKNIQEFNILFHENELLRPFKISGILTDRNNKETRLKSIDIIPGEYKFNMELE